LILTARNHEEDKIRGFRVGADDYVTKPFSIRELLARIDAMLRRGARYTSEPREATLGFGEIAIDVGARIVRRKGVIVPLTPKAFELLLALYQRRGKTASRLELLRDVWGYEDGIQTRTVDSHVFELRRRLEADPVNPVHLHTVRG